MFKRLRKKDPKFEEIDRFGIVRIQSGWLVRLGTHMGTPRFRRYIGDSKHGGNRVKAFLEAVELVKENRDKYKRIMFPKTNAVKGLTFTKQFNNLNRYSREDPSKRTFYFTWKYNYLSNDGRAANRTFTFWTSGLIFERYLEAIGFALSLGIDVDLDKIDDYFFQYIERLLGCVNSFDLDKSDIGVLSSEEDKAILKYKYLRRIS
ncbi:MAG: hypothetical protein JSU85_10745 [Candidatus Zixiibacteriota bacterium]|nr:MAG: hypothetical protein JSU85_10745 [candidate division Zixibacteria bacterium]